LRPGAEGLSLLAVPLNVDVLRALEDEELSLTDLRQAVGHPPATTMRSYLRTLTELGVLERRQEGGFPGSVSIALARSGKGLLRVGAVLQRWLQRAPTGPVTLGTTAAKSAIKALVGGWSSNAIRAIAARPFALTELHRLMPQISYPTLERRLTAMRMVGLIEARRIGAGSGTPYSATQWLRLAVAPLAAAAGWEQEFLSSQAAPVGRSDIESTFLLTIPLLLHLPSDLCGMCRLAVELRGDPDPEYVGAMVALEEGRVTSCMARLAGEADGWAVGTPLDWFRWVNGEGDPRLDFGGDVYLASAVAEGLREALASAGRV
jgi:DNA-binding HxlR family transcriptional regulator